VAVTVRVARDDAAFLTRMLVDESTPELTIGCRRPERENDPGGGTSVVS
jgi:hypothetical protein